MGVRRGQGIENSKEYPPPSDINDFMKTKSNQTNVVILGRPLMRKSRKLQLQEGMDKISTMHNTTSNDVKEEVPEYSREAYYD